MRTQLLHTNLCRYPSCTIDRQAHPRMHTCLQRHEIKQGHQATGQPGTAPHAHSSSLPPTAVPSAVLLLATRKRRLSTWLLACMSKSKSEFGLLLYYRIDPRHFILLSSYMARQNLGAEIPTAKTFCAACDIQLAPQLRAVLKLPQPADFCKYFCLFFSLWVGCVGAVGQGRSRSDRWTSFYGFSCM